MEPQRASSTPLSPEDLSFWYADQPRQRTAMALLMLLDRRPERERLRAAAWRAVQAVPRLQQRVVDAPFDLALPRWEDDPTFDLDFHVRRYGLPAAAPGEDDLAVLFRTLGPIYERPFDRTRPLWEMIEIERPGPGAAVFFKLHHAVADGVGGNAILAALTDAERSGEPLAPAPEKAPGAWPAPEAGERWLRALRDRAAQDGARARALTGALWSAARSPAEIVRAARIVGALAAELGERGRSPLRAAGRARHLTGMTLPFAPLREAKRALGGQMIDVMLTAVAGAVGGWCRDQGLRDLRELVTLVPINLRPPELQGLAAGVGNRATGILVRLPLAIRDPRARFSAVHRRVVARKQHPAARFYPQLAAWLALLPRPAYRALAYAGSQAVGLIVTNVPGVPVARHLAGARIEAAYPFAPVAPHAPVSVALYGYCDQLFVGIDADATTVPDLDVLRDRLAASFAEVIEAARRPPQRGSRRRES